MQNFFDNLLEVFDKEWSIFLKPFSLGKILSIIEVKQYYLHMIAFKSNRILELRLPDFETKKIVLRKKFNCLK